MTKKLPNYLRTFRKRSGLSQAEVAYLLGCEYGTNISRYECNSRLPNLKTVLALEIIYQIESKHLFEGFYHDTAYQVKKRAARLEQRLRKQKRDPSTLHKLRCIENLLNALSEDASLQS